MALGLGITGSLGSRTSSAAHSAHPAKPPRAVVCLCAGAAAGGASSRASHDAAGHLPAGRGEAAEAGTPEGLLVLALPLMRVVGTVDSN